MTAKRPAQSPTNAPLSALCLALVLALSYASLAECKPKKNSLMQPPAPRPAPDNVVTPPGEEAYFPVRPDGQPFLLNIDNSVNLTDAINGFYYDPKWRGEVWAPFDQISLIERATRKMATWPEYDQANQYRKFNHVNKFFERYSGFGP